MSDAAPSRSSLCARGEHARCSHVASLGIVSLWRPRRYAESTVLLCDCGCHAGCSLAAQRTAPRDAWRQQCTCPGAVRVRQADERTDQRRRELAAVVAEARGEGHLDAEEIERRLRAVFEAHGERPPPLTGYSRVAAAATARRGTRTARLLWMGVRAVVGVVRWARQPVDGSAGHNRAEFRKGYRSAGALAGIAAALTLAACLSNGWRRPLWVVGAAVSWLAVGWAGALVTGVTLIARAAEQRAAPAS